MMEQSNVLFLIKLRLTFKVKINFVIKWNKFQGSSWYEVMNRPCKILVRHYEFLNRIIILLSTKKGHLILEGTPLTVMP